MNGNKLLLFATAVVGIVLWNMPNTISSFSGTHTFYTGSSPCEKCHGDISIASHTNSSAHDNFTCITCHRGEPNITYNSNSTVGEEAHSSSMGSCTDCHSLLNMTVSPTSTLTVTGNTTTTLTVTGNTRNATTTLTVTGNLSLTG